MDKTSLPWRCLAVATTIATLTSGQARADGDIFADTVVDFHPGNGSTRTNPYAAVGKPGDIVGLGSGFDGVYSPFNPHYEAQQVVQLGEGGDLTLRLACAVDVNTGRLELGIFTNAGLVDGSYPNGINAGNFGDDSVEIDVSPDGVSWTTVGAINCAFPASAFTDSSTAYQADASGLTPADFGKPHDLQLADLDGLNHGQVLDRLAGSAGGTWIDLSATGLTRVAFVRFRVPDDGDQNTANSFELAAVSINASASAPLPFRLEFTEDFATTPLGTRANSPPGHAIYSDEKLEVAFDLATPTARTSWTLGKSLTDQDSFSCRVEFTVNAIDFTNSNFGQLSFGLINSATTGNTRTSSPSDAWDLLTVDYFPNEQFATFTPTVIGSQQPGQTDAFANLSFPSGSASLINDFDEIQQLPEDTPLTATLDYDAATRLLTLRLKDQAINADFTNTDNDVSTITHTIPMDIEFNVDSFAIICWNESSGGTANLSFRKLQVTTPAPATNYYSWADANIAAPLDRAVDGDADEDGLNNLLDYALLDGAPTFETSQNTIGLRWRKLASISDTIVRPMLSTDLQSWSPLPVSAIEAEPGILENSTSTSLSTERKFLRLEAHRP